MISGRHWLLVVPLLLVTSVQAVRDAYAQQPYRGIIINSVTNLHAEGDDLWVGPFLSTTSDNGATWLVADADSLAGFANRVYSIDIEGDIIWAGLGDTRTITQTGGAQQVADQARGFIYSTDGGASWTYRTPLPPSDNDPKTTGILDQPEDSLIAYGNEILVTLPITVPEQSPPWDIDYDPVTGHLWTANQLAGLRRSTDEGRTWERIVLPPDTTDYLDPSLGYNFPLFVQPTRVAVDQFFGLNFQLFSVLVDATGTVWAGSAGGLNRSDDQGQSWYHFTAENGLPGDWILSIEEQLRPGGDPAIWVATGPGRNPNQYFGAAVSRDHGETFEQVLVNETVYDFAFEETNVYIAGLGGLFISGDGGLTFRRERNFYDPAFPERSQLPITAAYSVAVTPDALWVGTEDGLFRSSDQGNTWRLFRSEVPLSPEGLPSVVPASSVPEVEAYAYPNPFSPSSDRLMRIRYRASSSGAVTIRIMDFGMNLVRRLTGSGTAGNEQEIAWDGTDEGGLRVANGPYFYVIQTGDDTFRGKILVLE